MQLVVMAALLVLAEVGQGCRFICHLKNVSIPVESCSAVEFIHTTICEGLCYQEVTEGSDFNSRSEFCSFVRLINVFSNADAGFYSHLVCF